jgi:hypothetical protein
VTYNYVFYCRPRYVEQLCFQIKHLDTEAKTELISEEKYATVQVSTTIDPKTLEQKYDSVLGTKEV